MNKKRTLFWQIFSVIAAALIVAGGALLFRGRHYVWIALCLSVLACAAVFFTFERNDRAGRYGGSFSNGTFCFCVAPRL